MPNPTVVLSVLVAALGAVGVALALRRAGRRRVLARLTAEQRADILEQALSRARSKTLGRRRA